LVGKKKVSLSLYQRRRRPPATESQSLQVPVIEISTDVPSGMGEQGENASMLVDNVGG
jgi:hypothetical protein